MKKGVFFTIDALLASGIIIISIVLISKFYYSEQQTTNINYASKDIVNVLSSMTVDGANNEYVKNLTASGLITDTNNTLIEQIGDFWANDNINIARNFTKNLTDDIVPKNYGFSVLVDGEEIYSRNIPVTKSLVSTRKIISGIAKAKPTNGYTARVLLNGIKSKKTSSYAYFGGYEGDGNLTKKLILPNDVISFNSSYLEVGGGGNFKLYINNIYSGNYTKGSSGGGPMLADKWNISSDYLINFRPGENIININFTSGNSYIAGGFLKVTYTTSSYNGTEIPGYEKYNFPGIDGNINLYSSIYVPGSLEHMKVFLNYSSNYTVFLRIGNVTVYEGIGTGGISSYNQTENLPASQELTPDSSTVLLLHFEEGSGQYVNDSSQYKNNGTMGANNAAATDDPSWNISAKFGNYALKFDGVNDFVNMSNLADKIENSTSITYEFWIMPLTSSGTTIFSLRNNTVDTRPRIEIRVLGGTDIYYEAVGALPDEFLINVPNVVSIGVWSHIAITANKNSTRIYVDGIEKNSSNGSRAPGNISSDFNVFTLGRRANTGAPDYLKALIDEVSIWNISLSSQDILDHYNKGALAVTNSSSQSGNITLDNSLLSSLLDYNSLSERTVPLRLGIVNATTLGSAADAVLVSDVSGSMDWCSKVTSETVSSAQFDNSKGCTYFFGFWYWFYYNFTPNYGYSNYNRTLWNNGTDTLCGCRYNTICQNDARKLDIYINSSTQFVNTIYNTIGNRVGLVEYTDNSVTAYKSNCSSSSVTTVPFSDSIVRYINLTSTKPWLIGNISSTSAWWGTCTCCGMNKAVDLIQSQNDPLRKKYIVLMSDGAANVACTQQPNSTATADAVQSAWDACNKNISVYAIAYGADADASTMKRMNCSGGKFYNATDTSALNQAYLEIAGEINKLSYSGQTINISGALLRSIVYPSSNIAFNYTIISSPFNKLPLGFETERFGNNISSGYLYVYPNTSVQDAKVTSYSESKWTDSLLVNGNSVYRLSDYGGDYEILGDPFAVNIPPGNINSGNNSLTISTGINATDSGGGSVDSKVIYTLLLNGFADYSEVVSKSDGCSWALSFEDGTSSTVKVPPYYSGSALCSFLTKTYDSNDALDNAVFQLFNNLDLDKDGKLDVNIESSNLNVNTLTVSKVPSLWGPAIIEIRVWE